MPFLFVSATPQIEPQIWVPLYAVKLAHLLVEAQIRDQEPRSHLCRCILVWHQAQSLLAERLFARDSRSTDREPRVLCGPFIINKTQCACRLGEEVFVLVVDKGNDGSLGGQAQGDELCEGSKSSIGKGLLGSEIVCLRLKLINEVSLKTERDLGHICQILGLVVSLSSKPQS